MWLGLVIITEPPVGAADGQAYRGFDLRIVIESTLYFRARSIKNNGNLQIAQRCRGDVDGTEEILPQELIDSARGLSLTGLAEREHRRGCCTPGQRDEHAQDPCEQDLVATNQLAQQVERARRTRFDRLSKGQKRQLSLTAAISTSPQLLILDDPTLGLDPVARRELFEELVSELADGGTSVFMTTHDLAGVEGIADRVSMIKDGHLLVDEGLEALKSRFRRLEFPSEEGSLGEAVAAEMRPLQSAAGGDGGVVVGGFDEGALSRISQASPAAQVTAEPMSLEEIFVALCGENGGGK